MYCTCSQRVKVTIIRIDTRINTNKSQKHNTVQKSNCLRMCRVSFIYSLETCKQSDILSVST